MEPIVNNPNDYKVVEFFNSTDFDFTPELGAMYDSRPLFVGSGERRQFPYHIGHRLAENLAKAVLIKGAPLHDPNAANPTGTPLWGEEKVRALKSTFLTELYMDDKPIALTETQRLFNKVTDLEKLFNEKEAKRVQEGKPKEPVQTVQEIVAPETLPKAPVAKAEAGTPKTYQDKQEVIAELEKRGITHDKRMTKANLIKLLN